MGVERQYREIEAGTRFDLKKALSFGIAASYNFQPVSDEEKSAYQIGLGKWISLRNLPALDSRLFSGGNMWRGFTYEMVVGGKFSFVKESSAESDHKKLANKRIRKILYNEGDEKEIGARHLDVKSAQSFRDGQALALDYLDFTNYWVPQVYNLEVTEILPEHAWEFFKIHRRIQQDAGDSHPILGRMYLFSTKEQPLERAIKEFRYGEALGICDYLEVLLINLTAERHTESLIRDSKGIKVVQDEIEQARIHSFDIYSRLEGIQIARRTILLRMENPATFPLDEGLIDAIALERYEDAAVLRKLALEMKQYKKLPE